MNRLAVALLASAVAGGCSNIKYYVKSPQGRLCFDSCIDTARLCKARDPDMSSACVTAEHKCKQRCPDVVWSEEDDNFQVKWHSSKKPVQVTGVGPQYAPRTANIDTVYVRESNCKNRICAVCPQYVTKARCTYVS